MRALIRFMAFTLFLGGLGTGYVFYRLNQPFQGFSEPVFVEFPRGTSSGQIATMLADKGVVQDRLLFLAARVIRRGSHLQAGEYRFEKAASAFDVYGRIARGDIYYLELLIPEGFNIFDIAAAVKALSVKEKRSTLQAADFLAAARNPALIRDLDPKAESLEGYLFPNKYRIYPHTTATQLCGQMTSEFRTQWHALHVSADMHRTVTLASLVEREAKLPQERARVASVFHNRLKLGMKLDCDPTTVYAALLEGRYRGVIHRSDLDSKNPYNTYQHPGLPPGPIANPGLRSLQAALEPAKTPFLFFVAKPDGSGGHNFSESLRQHEAAVTQYRKNGH